MTPLMLNSLDDPSQHIRSFPRERACSLFKPQTNHQPFYFTFFFFFLSRYTPFHGHQMTWQFLPSPLQPASAPSPGEPAALMGAAAPSARHCTLQAVLGRGLRQGTKGQGMWAPMLKAFSPKLTDQFFHPLRCLPENGYLVRYHLVCNRNNRAPKVHASLPQPACLRV